MNISLVSACNAMSHVQDRVAHFAMEVYRARGRAARAASAVHVGPTVRNLVAHELRAAVVKNEELLAIAQATEAKAQPQFAHVLSRFPAANEERFEPLPDDHDTAKKFAVDGDKTPLKA